MIDSCCAGELFTTLV